jgi:mannitol-1-phosphate 5-dehydrogenase
MAHKTIVIWGAGKIGRGFVADLFHSAGYGIVFVDESAALITQLREAGHYTVVRAESLERRQDVLIKGYTALSTGQTAEISEAVAAANILAIAVFPGHFAQVAQQLAPGIARRQAKRRDVPLDVILCTNLAHAGPRFRDLLHDALPSGAREYLESHIGIVESLVIRIVTKPPGELHRREPLLVWTNGYPELPVDQHGFKGEISQVPGLRLVDDMRAEETRKLYTYNTFQATLAYLGAGRGYDLAVECMADPQVRSEAAGVLDEASQALQAEYDFSAGEMVRWVRDVMTQSTNPVLGDTVKRLAADPGRKLNREDRLIGPTLLARKHGVGTKHLVRAIAAGLRYNDPDDPGAVYVQQRIAALGLSAAVREVCGLSNAELDLLEAVVRNYHRPRVDKT